MEPTITDYYYISSGLVEIGGSSNYGQSETVYTSSGGVSLESSTVASFRFEKDVDFLWNVDYRIEKELEFTWSYGQLPIYWYRIVGQGIDGGQCGPLQGPSCCQQFVLNIHARTLTELCEKLSRRRYKFPIESVERYSRPAETSVLNAQDLAGVNNDCNVLIPVEVCNIPQCAEFCVQGDTIVKAGFSMTVQVDSFFTYVASGSIFTGGGVTASYDKNLPEFVVVSEGGIQIDGNAICYPDHFNATGGIRASGSSYLESSRWSYVGGNWPNITRRLRAVEAESLANQRQDIAWQLPERALNNDNVYTQADISYGKTSEFLIVRNFHFGLPSDAVILGIKVRIDRLSTQTGIRDKELYLLHGDDIVSDNLADTSNDWPLIATTKVYGSDGINPGTPWRSPNGDDYLGAFDPDEINDSLFGIAIRVRAQTSLPVALAKIDYLSMEVFYEDAQGSILRIGQNLVTPTVSPVYHYTSTGKITLHSDNHTSLALKFISKGLGVDGFEFIQLSGDSTLNLEEVVSGGAELSSEALVSPHDIIASGGALASGIAVVEPYFEIASGGIIIGGKSRVVQSKSYISSGSLTIDGNAYTPQVKFTFGASGGLSLGSVLSVVSSAFTYVSDGSTSFVLGGADYSSSDQGVIVVSSGMSMDVFDMIASFSTDVDLNNATPLTSSVSKCGCLTIPLVVNLTHNIARNNMLAQFLLRNNYTISNILRLRYNTVNDSWQSNLHYRGLSASNNDRESWDMIFELQCSDIIGGISIGRSIWKLAVQIIRKNLTTLELSETRIVVGILPDLLCDSTNSQLDFIVSYNTELNFAVIDPNAVVYQNTIFDNIGLFRNQSWFNDPVLILKLSQKLDTLINRVDVTDAVLV